MKRLQNYFYNGFNFGEDGLGKKNVSQYWISYDLPATPSTSP